MTNHQTSHQSRRFCASAKDLCTSVKDIRDHVFTNNKTIYKTCIMLAQKFLNFMGSKFGPSKSNLLQQGKVILHRTKKPCHTGIICVELVQRLVLVHYYTSSNIKG